MGAHKGRFGKMDAEAATALEAAGTLDELAGNNCSRGRHKGDSRSNRKIQVALFTKAALTKMLCRHNKGLRKR
jgi:hypothetical protein